MNKQEFLEKLQHDLAQAKSTDAFNAHGARNEMRVGARFLDILQNLLKSIDLSGMTREEFLAAVSTAYDQFAAPAILSMGPWGILVNSLVKAGVMAAAGRFYDNHSGKS